MMKFQRGNDPRDSLNLGIHRSIREMEKRLETYSCLILTPKDLSVSGHRNFLYGGFNSFNSKVSDFNIGITELYKAPLIIFKSSKDIDNIFIKIIKSRWDSPKIININKLQDLFLFYEKEYMKITDRYRIKL